MPHPMRVAGCDARGIAPGPRPVPICRIMHDGDHRHHGARMPAAGGALGVGLGVRNVIHRDYPIPGSPHDLFKIVR